MFAVVGKARLRASDCCPAQSMTLVYTAERRSITAARLERTLQDDEQALGKATPGHVYSGTKEAILETRDNLKAETLDRRRAINLGEEAELLP